MNQWKEDSIHSLLSIPFHQLLSSAFPKSRQEDKCLDFLYYFEYRYFRFLLNPLTGQFEPNYAWTDPTWTSIPSVLNQDGIQDHVNWKCSIFGKNQIDIKEKSNLELLIDEVLHPFFMFQIASIILWSLDDYYYYAACILIISVSSSIATFVETKKNVSRMQLLAQYSCSITVWRNGQWSTLSSEDLVPGDVFQIKLGSDNILPCDAVLLTGDCIVNESMLTGESLPVSKAPIPDSELKSLDFESEEPSSSAHMSKYFLFSGTKVIRVRGSKEKNSNLRHAEKRLPLALVVRTGFNTAKGSLVRSMLFPRPNTFKFYQDSFRFIGVLSLISILGFLGSLYNFILLKINWQVIVIRALDLITIAVPPALPATMAIGTTFAISRLRRSNIFCTSPPRVNIGGKINMMCFDKTGTLTEEGLDVLGVRFTVSKENEVEDPTTEAEEGLLRFSRIYTTIDSLLPKPLVIDELRNPSPVTSKSLSGVSLMQIKEPGDPNREEDFPYPLIVCAMACCHSIKVVSGELMGDPLDLKMFQFTKWNIDEDGTTTGFKNPNKLAAVMTVRPPWIPSPDSVQSGEHKGPEDAFTELAIIKSFEFASNLRRMSVVLYRNRYSSSLHTQTIMEEQEDPLLMTRDFEVFVKGAPEVMRSICTPDSLPFDYEDQLRYYTHHGYRVLAVAWKPIIKESFSKVNQMQRESIESGLRFLGFIIFENKLKPGTLPVVRTLNKANIRQVMCTGDNILTSVSVSRECELIRKDQRVFVPRFVSGYSHEENAVIAWEDVDDPKFKLDPTTFLTLYNETSILPRESYSSFGSIVPTGDYVLAITGEAFQWMLDFASDEVFERMLVKCQIFARMSPDQKHFLVENLQYIGYCVGFCGDGTNDCGALKSADIGLSLSEAEASVAAPFTSQDKDLDCVLKVIREGRAALVTSFCCFKYMALYSLIQFTSVSLLYSLAQNIGDFQFMYIDLCLIIPIAVFMGQTGPYSSIYKKRPTASLVSKKVLTSLAGQIFFQFLFQCGSFMWVRSQSWYEPGTADMDNQLYRSMENTVIFLISSFQYISVAIVFTVGPPYQSSIWKNIPLISLIIVLIAFTTLLTLNPPAYFSELLVLVDIPWIGRLTLLSFAFMNFLCAWVTERFLAPYFAKFIGYIQTWIYMLQIDPRNSAITSRRLAKIKKWESSGKKFKVIQQEFQ